MAVKIDRKSGVPIYQQVKNRIAEAIRNRELNPGDKLPTERDLALQLGISRNTVSTAYEQLVKEGLAESRQGRGTIVIGGEYNQVTESRVRDYIISLVDRGLEEAWQAGYSTDEFTDLINDYIREKEEAKRKVKAVFVECNIEQAGVFAGEMEEYSHFTVRPVVLSELISLSEDVVNIIKEARFIFTTFNHIAEVRNIVSEFGNNVYGLAVRPCLEGLIKIARYPKTTKFVVMSHSEDFHHKFKRNLGAAGLEGLQIMYNTTSNHKQMKKVFERADVIIVSPGRCEETRQLVNGEKDIIVFNTTLDTGSVKAALSKIGEQLSPSDKVT